MTIEWCDLGDIVNVVADDVDAVQEEMTLLKETVMAQKEMINALITRLLDAERRIKEMDDRTWKHEVQIQNIENDLDRSVDLLEKQGRELAVLVEEEEGGFLDNLERALGAII